MRRPNNEVEATEAPPGKPLWKRVLFFDLGFPGQIIEGGLKGLHILIFVILGVEVFNLPWASHTVVKPMEGLVLGAVSPWQRDGETLKTGARYTSEPAVVTLPLQCAERSYALHFSTKLLNAHSDAELVFPVGKVQAVLMMNHQGFTGFVLANGSRWSGSEKAEPIKYYIGDENMVSVYVHLSGEDAMVNVSINGDSCWWQGKQSELAMDRESSPWKVQGGDKFGIATVAGGVEVQSMALSWR